MNDLNFVLFLIFFIKKANKNSQINIIEAKSCNKWRKNLDFWFYGIRTYIMETPKLAYFLVFSTFSLKKKRYFNSVFGLKELL